MTVDRSESCFASFLLDLRFMLFRFLVVSVFLFQYSFAQDVERARKIVQTLSSPFYHGRGYVNGGDSLAAEFVEKEFKLCGLLPFKDSYFQPFSFPVNTFPGAMEVRIGKKKLVTGKDYILSPGSKGVKGKFKVIKIDSLFFTPGFNQAKLLGSGKNKALIYNTDYKKQLKKLEPAIRNLLTQFPVIVEVVPKKLTYSVSSEVDPQCTVQILTNSLPSKSRTIKLNIANTFVPIHNAKNVIGFFEGTSKKDSFLVITAHYDHLGQLGKNTYFPGANDNASGIAMMLELAKYYADSSQKLPYSMMFIGFAGEEAGLIGSQFYVNNPLFPLSKIKFLINLDLLGSGKEGITVVNGAVLPQQFSMLDSLNKKTNRIPKIVARGKASNSDHFPFSEKGVPAFFIYTLGEISAYHDIDDKANVVTFSKFREVFALLTDFLNLF
ncbi:MAG: M28 family peptidase [Opitutaceae bacterium]|nr:M28 family peptidase [Cytophagales bacterium]